MKLVVPNSAVELIRERGGRLYVWKQRNRCCGGATITLEAATEAPAAIDFRRFDDDSGFEGSGFELYLPAALGDLPDELHVEARRFPRRIEAYWNGCAWIA